MGGSDIHSVVGAQYAMVARSRKWRFFSLSLHTQGQNLDENVEAVHSSILFLLCRLAEDPPIQVVGHDCSDDLLADYLRRFQSFELFV